MSKFFRQFTRNFGLNFAEGRAHLVFFVLLLLDLAEGRDGPLGYLVRMFQVILELLVVAHAPLVRLLGQLGRLLGRWLLPPTVQRQLRLTPIHLGHEGRGKWGPPLGVPWHR